MSIVQELNKNKKYSIPGKYIHWTITKNKLELKAILEWQNYKDVEVQFSDPTLGRCEWLISNLDKNAIITVSWDIRHIKNNTRIIEKINTIIIPYAIPE